MDFSSLTPLEGGWSGQTFLAEAAGERSVVRVYPPGGRGEDAAPLVAFVGGPGLRLSVAHDYRVERPGSWLSGTHGPSP